MYLLVGVGGATLAGSCCAGWCFLCFGGGPQTGVYSLGKFRKRLVAPCVLVGLSVSWDSGGGFSFGRARFADVLQRKGLRFRKGTALADRSCLLKAACCS